MAGDNDMPAGAARPGEGKDRERWPRTGTNGGTAPDEELMMEITEASRPSPSAQSTADGRKSHRLVELLCGVIHQPGFSIGGEF